MSSCPGLYSLWLDGTCFPPSGGAHDSTHAWRHLTGRNAAPWPATTKLYAFSVSVCVDSFPRPLSPESVRSEAHGNISLWVDSGEVSAPCSQLHHTAWIREQRYIASRGLQSSWPCHETLLFGFVWGHMFWFPAQSHGKGVFDHHEKTHLASPAFCFSKVFKSRSQEFSVTGLELKAILPLTRLAGSPVPAPVISSSTEAGHVPVGLHRHIQPCSSSPLCPRAWTASHLPGRAASPRQCRHSRSSLHGQLVQGQQYCQLMKSCQMLPGLAGPVGNPTVTTVESKTRQELSISLGA